MLVLPLYLVQSVIYENISQKHNNSRQVTLTKWPVMHSNANASSWMYHDASASLVLLLLILHLPTFSKKYSVQPLTRSLTQTTY
jgi:hypothetical protein